jgi:hypothetical protein
VSTSYNDKEFSATTGVQDFKFRNVGPAPEGFPTEYVRDSYAREVFAATYEERRQAFVEHVLKNPGVDTVKGFFYELIRLEQGAGPVHESLLMAGLDYIDSRLDCADFALNGMLRLHYQFLDSELLSDEFRAKLKNSILSFKYWPDEPGIDSMCYWTENHHILFSTCELLAGQLYPDEVFTNSGHTGRQKQVRAKRRIEKWLELRFKAGFSEWLSNVYYDEDLPALLSLLDFADDSEIARRAGAVIDLMCLDMACNSYRGLFSCSHGRTYTKEKLNPYQESTTDTAKLLFGLGSFANEDNMSAVCFALSPNYRLPQVIFDIANDAGREEWISRQRMSIKFSEAERWGYGEKNLESAMGLLSYGGYVDPRTINHMVLMLDSFNWWDNKFFQEFAPVKKAMQVGSKFGLTTLVAWLLRKDMSRNNMDEVNLYTYRTPEYMLSTAQDYRKSYGGDQHHIWQATLDDEAVCFTTHPGGYGMQAPDAYWHGNGFMPRAIQHRNVAVILYRTPRTPNVVLSQTLEFTHAFFPADRFDCVVEKNGWLFGEKNGGYIALYSGNGYRWQQDGEYRGREVIASGRNNAWLVEMGRRDQYGSFEGFVEQVRTAPLAIRGLKITYQSPSVGVVEAAWSGDMTVAGVAVQTRDYPRYDNPACRAEFAADTVSVDYGGEKLGIEL